MKIKYIEHLDAIRALAVLLVIFFHLDISLFSGGFLGVDVFFVVSGYLITKTIKKEYETTNTISFQNFYRRRIRRLLPSLFLVLILSFGFGFLILSPSDFISFIDSMFYSSVAISNFHFLSESGYFDGSSHLKPLLHTWSLGVEEQFYFIWPITLFVIMKFFSGVKRIFLSLLILVLSFSLTLYVSENGLSDSIISIFISDSELSSRTDSIQFYLLPFRIYEFLIGATLVFLPAIKLKQESVKTNLNIIGFFLILFSVFYFDKNTVYLSSLNIIPCLGAGLLIITPASKFLSVLSNNIIVKLIGKASYTWYLFHWPVIVFYKHITGNDLNVFEQVALLVVSFLISVWVYNKYEKPMRFGQLKYTLRSNKTFVLGLIVFVLIFNSLRMNVNYSKGWLWRLDDSVTENILPVWGMEGYERIGVINKPFKGEAIDMFWYGDSHASQYSSAIDEIFVKKHGKFVYMANLRSLALPELINFRVKQDQIDKEKNDAVERMRRHPKGVLVFSYWWHMEKYCSKVLNEATGEYEYFERSIASFDQVYDKIDKLLKEIGDRKVIIFGENPIKDPKAIKFSEKLLKPKYLKALMDNQNTFKLDPYNQEVNQSIEAYFKNRDNVLFINPIEALCEGEDCVEKLNNEIYYSDNDHLSYNGTMKVLKYYEGSIIDFIEN